MITKIKNSVSGVSNMVSGASSVGGSISSDSINSISNSINNSINHNSSSSSSSTSRIKDNIKIENYNILIDKIEYNSNPILNNINKNSKLAYHGFIPTFHAIVNEQGYRGFTRLVIFVVLFGVLFVSFYYDYNESSLLLY